jgi:hypothetical protein
MFEHTSNSFLFMAAALVAIMVWLDGRTGRSNHAYAGKPSQPRGPAEQIPAPAPLQTTPQPRPTQAPTVGATAQPQPVVRAPDSATP